MCACVGMKKHWNIIFGPEIIPGHRMYWDVYQILSFFPYLFPKEQCKMCASVCALVGWPLKYHTWGERERERGK